MNLSRLDARLFVASLYFSTSLFPLPDFRVLSALHCQIKKTHRNRIKRNVSTPPPARATASNQKRKALLILSDENIVCSRKSWAIFFYVLLSPWDHKSSTKHHARFLVVVSKIFASNPSFFFFLALLSSGASLLANGLNGSGSKGNHKEDGSLRSQGLDGSKYCEDGPAKKRWECACVYVCVIPFVSQWVMKELYRALNLILV